MVKKILAIILVLLIPVVFISGCSVRHINQISQQVNDFPEDLYPYVGKNIELLVDKIPNLEETDENQYYSNCFMTAYLISKPEDEDDIVKEISLNSSSEYNLLGVSIGMSEKDAEKTLDGVCNKVTCKETKNGSETEEVYSGALTNKKEYSIQVTCKDNAVEEVIGYINNIQEFSK